MARPTAWAKWTNVHGNEAWAATLTAQEPATVLIRYNSQVDMSFRWSMGWFIFSEVMFFAAFFGALVVSIVSWIVNSSRAI